MEANVMLSFFPSLFVTGILFFSSQNKSMVSLASFTKHLSCLYGESKIVQKNIFPICLTSFADFTACTWLTLSHLCNSIIILYLPLCDSCYLHLARLEMFVAGYVISGITMSHSTYLLLLVVLF